MPWPDWTIINAIKYGRPHPRSKSASAPQLPSPPIDPAPVPIHDPEIFALLNEKPELLGDKMEKLFEKWGPKVVGDAWARFKSHCNCAARKEGVNRIDAWLRAKFGR